MRIAVCSHSVPFTTGGLELFASKLVDQLNAAGHQAEWVRIPFSFGPIERVVPTALAWRLIDLKDITGAPPDVALCLSFPAYLVSHPHKILWLCHQHRAAYDLFGTPRSNFQDDEQGRYYREAIRRLDRESLADVKAFFTISKNVANRLRATTGHDAEPLWIPAVHPAFEGEPTYEGFILHVGRITELKRPELVLKALKHAPGVKLVFAGAGNLEASLKALAGKEGLTDRVTFAGFVSDAALGDYYRRCSAVVFTPVDEDYGLISAESFLARKPVVSCRDSGGALELIEDGISGLICDPTPEAVGASMSTLAASPDLCRKMGDAGFAVANAITWPSVLARLTSAFP